MKNTYVEMFYRIFLLVWTFDVCILYSMYVCMYVCMYIYIYIYILFIYIYYLYIYIILYYIYIIYIWLPRFILVSLLVFSLYDCMNKWIQLTITINKLEIYELNNKWQSGKMSWSQWIPSNTHCRVPWPFLSFLSA